MSDSQTAIGICPDAPVFDLGNLHESSGIIRPINCVIHKIRNLLICVCPRQGYARCRPALNLEVVRCRKFAVRAGTDVIAHRACNLSPDRTNLIIISGIL